MIDEQDNGVKVDGVEATEPVNRVKRKVSGKVSGKKSAFQRWFIGLRDAEGGKEAANLVRKTEEGKLTIVIKGYPKEFTLESVCELAEEVGLKATIKSETGVGNYEGTVTKTLAEDSASGFLEYAND